MSGADHRTVGELPADSDVPPMRRSSRQHPDHASAMVRSFRASINVPWLIPGTRTCGGGHHPALATPPRRTCAHRVRRQRYPTFSSVVITGDNSMITRREVFEDVITKIRIAAPADKIVCRIGFRYQRDVDRLPTPTADAGYDSGDVVGLEVR